MSSMTEQQAAALGKRAARGRATRDQLIEVATRLFAEHGYEATSIEAVLAAAGVSRGALYHHFAGKEALFDAVFQALSMRITEELGATAAGATDPVDALNKVAVAWISMAGDAETQRILLVDAPSVLGWERWRTADEGRTLGAMRAMLQAISDSGRLEPALVAPFSHIILAALDELALVVARAEDPQAALAEGRSATEELLRRLLGS
jgi:AcrR family transcriptional regulator